MSSSWSSPRRDGWSDVLVGGIVALLFTLLLCGTLDDLGYTRDEGFYFHAAGRYEAWFRLLADDPGVAWARIDEFWRTNSEHPALIKSLFAWSHMLLFERWHVVSTEGTSYRFMTMVLSGVGVGLVYLWGARASGRLAGMVAALSLAAMPRFFFHAHLACFDAPVVTMWTLSAYAYWRAIERGGYPRALLAGLAFALALNTKHNAWFLPIVCTLHATVWWLTHRRDTRHLRRSAITLAAMATVGPVCFFLTWPWLYHDTVARLGAYVRFHLEHVYYNMEYLGRNYYEPPMPKSYAFVMTAVTVPATTLALFFVGLGGRLWSEAERRLRSAAAKDERSQGESAFDLELSTASLWLLAMAVQYAAWLRPTTPIFGGTKHWMTAYPFLALFAGVGATSAVRIFARHHAYARSVWFRAAAAIVLVVPGVIESGHAHPWGLSSYSPLIGGAAGGASLGLNRGFWGHTTGSVAELLNEIAPHGARVYLHDTAWPAWDMLVRDGRVRADLRAVGQVGDADVALYHHELHMQGVEYQEWVAFETAAPVYVAGLDGVPVIWVYTRKATTGR